MGLRRAVALVGSILVVAQTAQAVVPRTSRRPLADELTAMPAAQVTKPLRAQRQVRFHAVPSVAWQRFAVAARGQWRVSWDAATGVPSRIWGTGILAGGANASPQIAEWVARQVLADHINLLAPGAAVGDFELAANHSDGEIRSVGFIQRASGRRVVGGQVSFRFKRDRLFLIGSEALPHVVFFESKTRLSRVALHARVTDKLRQELDLPGAPVSSPGEEVVLPLVADDAVLSYRLASRVEINGGADGRYLAYVDPASGQLIAVHQQNRFAFGTLQYKSVDRHPGRARIDRPARRARVMLNGAAQTTTSDGTLTWSPDVVQSVSTSVVGDLATIFNKAVDGVLATADLPLTPSGQALWDVSADELQDAQVQAFVATNRVKEYVRAYIDPTMPKLDESFTVNVNIAQHCNAFYDGKSINFFQANDKCQNTALLEDVVFHEFGHALHAAEIIQGVGDFDGAMGEGVADFLAASMTNDSGMGRGFFHSDLPLRDIDPVDSEFRWPEDIKAIHHTGLIYGGAFWDLRKALIATHGETAGVALVNKLYLATLRRAVSIPSSLIEALAADDDDGDLENGTPNECAIRDAFGRHGLRTVTGVIANPGVLAERALTTSVRVELSGLTTRCGGDEIEGVTLDWKPGASGLPAAGSAALTAAAPGTYVGPLPLATEDAVYFAAKVRFKDGSILTLADNLADPFYTVYQGATVPLYCTSFDEDPFAAGWTHGASEGVASPWAWGPASGGPSDPASAFTGSHMLSQAPGASYPPEASSFVELPLIDVGQWSDVRLQYRRWLAVEDSHYDKARVTVDGQQAWINFTANAGDSSAIHHVDREWRFHDVPLSVSALGHTLQIGFDLTADAGLHLGGWAIDDLCVVANIHSICGDGVQALTEQCDDGAGNANRADACRTFCKLPTCGDQIIDDDEVCDRGLKGDATCTAECKSAEVAPAGCCSANGGPGALGLSALVGALLFGTRRRRRAR